MTNSRCLGLTAIAGLMLGFVWVDSESGSVVGLSEAPTPGRHAFSLDVDGMTRHYLVHVPCGYQAAKDWPVVVMFHGGGGRAEVAMDETGWAAKADRAGFLAVFPEGTRSHPDRPARFAGNPQSWNDGSKRPTVGAVERGVDDMAFVDAMLDDLKSRFAVDTHRIYATGFSNGASMAFRLARQRPTTFAAVAPIAGNDWLEELKPDRAVPVLYITGTEDPLNPIDGGEVRMRIGRRSFGQKPPVRQLIDRWVGLHRVVDDPRVVFDRDGARGLAYAGRSGEQAVVYYTLDGHGHHWPGGRSLLPTWLVGPNIASLSATDTVWQFFAAHALPND